MIISNNIAHTSLLSNNTAISTGLRKKDLWMDFLTDSRIATLPLIIDPRTKNIMKCMVFAQIFQKSNLSKPRRVKSNQVAGDQRCDSLKNQASQVAVGQIGNTWSNPLGFWSTVYHWSACSACFRIPNDHHQILDFSSKSDYRSPAIKSDSAPDDLLKSLLSWNPITKSARFVN